MAKSIDEGQLHHVYPPSHLPYSSVLVTALFDKSPYVLPLIAKRTIRDEWEATRDAVIKDIREELLGAEVNLIVDYDAIWKVIVDAKKVP
jgi:hypothetical protein